MSRRMEEELAKAAKKGSVHAIKRLGQLASVQSGALNFPRIFAILLSCLSSQKVPPDTPIDWSKPGIYDSHFAIVCFTSLSTALHECHDVSNERAELQLIQEHWLAIRNWIVFFIAEVAPALKRDGNQLQVSDVGRHEVWIDLSQFMYTLHNVLRRTGSLELAWSSAEYIRSVFYMWTAHAHHIDANTADLKDLETEVFISNTITVGYLFNARGESIYASIIPDFPQLANYLGKALLLAIRMPYPHLQLLIFTLAIISDSKDQFDPLTIAERDRLASNVVRSVRHMLLRLDAAHSPLDSVILPAIECAALSLTRIIPTTNTHHIGFLAGLLDAGLFPVLGRLTLLGTCQCTDEHCAWTAAKSRDVDLEKSAWSGVVRLIPSVIYHNGGNLALFGQLRRGIRWMVRDKEVCEKRCANKGLKLLQPGAWHTWESVFSYVEGSLAIRDQFEKISSKLCCGPKCSSPAMPVRRFKLCAGCNRPAYCSRECQKEDWLLSHRQVCYSGDDTC